ncbi:hypothetical protein CCS41_11930 [Candidatus Fukatsuia symbiotica]|uniref:Uncharacterized protein n=1 Tax=Candidatus Fukatsuia symbiotica TaxID=1878942 RepID=A0A2U8IA93_9GAMM|nr:hypothetical protein CCS41_11930 [Candidatus Fukatsuia symbiotica]
MGVYMFGKCFIIMHKLKYHQDRTENILLKFIFFYFYLFFRQCGHFFFMLRIKSFQIECRDLNVFVESTKGD